MFNFTSLLVVFIAQSVGYMVGAVFNVVVSEQGLTNFSNSVIINRSSTLELKLSGWGTIIREQTSKP